MIPVSRVVNYDWFSQNRRPNGVRPDWRDASITAIFKKGNRSEPGNYRPVSLTSIICKIMESIIKDKLVEHLQNFNLLNDSQHGFMKGKSCSTNLLEYLENVTKFLDQGDPLDNNNNTILACPINIKSQSTG